MKRWERVEDYILRHGGEGFRFTHADYAADTGRGGNMASCDFYAQQQEQRRRPHRLKDGTIGGGSRARFVIFRNPDTRTANAVWTVGVRKKDFRNRNESLISDLKCNLNSAWEPELQRMQELNPALAAHVRRVLPGVLDHCIGILELTVRGVDDDEAPVA